MALFHALKPRGGWVELSSCFEREGGLLHVLKTGGGGSF